MPENLNFGDSKPAAAGKAAISPRVALVPVDSVRVMLGISSDQVHRRIQSGQILWVFNLATRCKGQSPNRALRVWADEVTSGQSVAGLALPLVVTRILGERATFTRGDLEIRWCLNRFVLMMMIRNGLPQVNGRIARQALVEYLSARWLGQNAKLN